MSQKKVVNLESITVRGKFHTAENDFNIIVKSIMGVLECLHWSTVAKMGESLMVIKLRKPYDMISSKEYSDAWRKRITTSRHGTPVFVFITVIEHLASGALLEVECRPAMWFRITQLQEEKFTENSVQEALMECKILVKQLMSVLKAKEVEPISVYPIIQRTEIKNRLLNLGLKEMVSHLDDAERHIVQNDFVESLTSSRTSFEKMIDWHMKKRGLEQTNNYKNDLERLGARGYLDPDTAQLLQSYYRCLSVIGVHEKGTPPCLYEAQMWYGMTLIVLDYFANKLP